MQDQTDLGVLALQWPSFFAPLGWKVLGIPNWEEVAREYRLTPIEDIRGTDQQQQQQQTGAKAGASASQTISMAGATANADGSDSGMGKSLSYASLQSNGTESSTQGSPMKGGRGAASRGGYVTAVLACGYQDNSVVLQCPS
jgi:hypothetical protein